MDDPAQELVSQLFLLYCARPADPAGLEFWCAQIAATAPTNSAMGSAVASAAVGYSTLPSAALLFDQSTPIAGADDKSDALALVKAFYVNGVGRAATVAEQAYFFAHWQRRELTAIQLAWFLVEQLSGQDFAAYQRRLQRAQQFTEEVIATGRPYRGEHIAEAQLFLRG